MKGSLIALLFTLWATTLGAQGFAGLGQNAEGFAVPQPGVALRFPADHGPHPSYRIEWWYLTANLTGADGRDYGVQWTLFRSAQAPQKGTEWASPQAWMGHAALTTPDRHFVAERLARGGTGQAGVTVEPFVAWIDDWQMVSMAEGGDAYDALQLQARGADFSYDLALSAQGPLVAQGDQGYSVKSSSGQASYYYSQPFYDVSGSLRLPEGDMPVTGRAWLDREYSSQPLDEGQTGWDWFSLHLGDGAKVMGFGLRSEAGGIYTSATWIDADGTATPYPDGALRMTPLARHTTAGRTLPVRWRVQLADRGLDITTEPVNADAWMPTLFPYWEGPIRFEGSHSGVGYLEMTGYEAQP